MSAVVINFNAPELNRLAGHLASEECLQRYVRTYVNKNRWWERGLARLPLGGRLYSHTFGRRRIGDPRLLNLTSEAGLAAEMIRAAISRVRRLPARVRNNWAPRLDDHLRQAVAAAGGRAMQGADVVVGHVGFALPAFREASLRGARRVLNYSTVHHRYQRASIAVEKLCEPEFAPTWQSFDRSWGPRYEAHLDAEIELAQVILVGSSFARSTFIEAGVQAEKLHVIPYGVDGDTFYPASEPRAEGPVRIVYAGGLYQGKGLSYLLRAFDSMRDQATELVLIGSFVAGDAPFAPYRNLFQHVPHCTREELAEQYRRADIFVFPTLSDGMGLVVLEAMASGLPVVVTPNGPGDIVRNGVDGLVVPARDADALADALRKLRSDPELRRRLGENARARALEFTWERYSRSVVELLHPKLGQQTPEPVAADRGVG